MEYTDCHLPEKFCIMRYLHDYTLIQEYLGHIIGLEE